MKISYLSIVGKGKLEEVVWTGCQSGDSISLPLEYLSWDLHESWVCRPSITELATWKVMHGLTYTLDEQESKDNQKGDFQSCLEKLVSEPWASRPYRTWKQG